MQQFVSNLPHMIMALIAIAAVTILALAGTISGGEALAVIGAASGFTMAAGATSASAYAAPGSGHLPSLSSGQTVTETTTHQITSDSPPVKVVQ
jgi:type IV secretory pathway TrbL component